jgi:hypothetical protein
MFNVAEDLRIITFMNSHVHFYPKKL